MAKKDSRQDFQRIRADLKAGKYKCLYLFMGEETYYTQLLSRYIAQNILTPEEQAFNQSVFYGNDVTAAQVIDNAKRYPVMAEHQVIIVREAQQMKNPELIAKYIKAPQPSTLLVLCYMGKSIDKRGTLYKSLSQAPALCEIMESRPLREEEVPAWIDDYLQEKGLRIDPDASMLLADYLGTDLNRIVMELDKLLILIPKEQKNLSAKLIGDCVGINREYSPFALCKHLSTRNFAKVQQIAGFMADNSKNYPLAMLLTILQMHFSRILKYQAIKMQEPSMPPAQIASELKMNPYFLREIETAAANYPFNDTLRAIQLIEQFDSRYKSNERGTATDGELLMELLCRIMG